MDFDDLIMNTILLFDKNPDVLAYYQGKFQYIHVDEYQDTNHAQYQLVQLLAKRFKNLCNVGDADQLFGYVALICKIFWILSRTIPRLKSFC
jgi:DNA helicase-2/ATP-dependent DNA helicase PcrA